MFIIVQFLVYAPFQFKRLRVHILTHYKQLASQIIAFLNALKPLAAQNPNAHGNYQRARPAAYNKGLVQFKVRLSVYSIGQFGE